MATGVDLPRLDLLSNCSKLKELHLPHSTQVDHMEGFEAAMSALIELEELTSLNLARPEQAEMFTSGLTEIIDDQAEEVDEEAQDTGAGYRRLW